jgi:hypothetical protein
VVYCDTAVLGSVVQADYVVHVGGVQPASVVHGDNAVFEHAFQSDYVVHDDVVLDDAYAVQVGSVIHGDSVVQYDDDDVQGGCAGMTDEALTAHGFAEGDTGDSVSKHYYVLIDWNDVAVYGMFQLKT